MKWVLFLNAGQLLLCVSIFCLGLVIGAKDKEARILRAGGAHVEIDTNGNHHLIIGKP